MIRTNSRVAAVRIPAFCLRIVTKARCSLKNARVGVLSSLLFKYLDKRRLIPSCRCSASICPEAQTSSDPTVKPAQTTWRSFSPRALCTVGEMARGSEVAHQAVVYLCYLACPNMHMVADLMVSTTKDTWFLLHTVCLQAPRTRTTSYELG